MAGWREKTDLIGIVIGILGKLDSAVPEAAAAAPVVVVVVGGSSAFNDVNRSGELDERVRM